MSREIYKRTVAPHNFRVGADGGVPSDNVQAAILLMQDNQEWVGRDKFLCISPELFGVKTRISAPYLFATKAYSANSPQRELGDELITNVADREFTSDTGFWTKSHANITIGNGLATYNSVPGGFGILRGSGLVVPSKEYIITYKINIVSGAIQIYFYGSNQTLTQRTTSGTYTERFISAVGSTSMLLMALGTFTGSIDDISIREVLNADLTQSTANSQPYLSKIAPSEPQSLLNTNGDSRFMSHPAISFAANEKWCAEVVLSSERSTRATDYISICGDSSEIKTAFAFNWGGVDKFTFRNGNTPTANYIFTNSDSKKAIGKISIVTLVADGAGNLSLYFNGAFVQTLTAITVAKFNALFEISGLYRFNGKGYYYSIIPDAPSASRIQYRAALLRSIFAEIPTVKIAGLDVAIRALDIVYTPAGNVIPEVQLASNTERITNAADRSFSSDTGFWSKTAQVTIGSGIANIKSTDGSYQTLSCSPGLVSGRYYKLSYEIIANRAGAIAVSFGSTSTSLSSTVGAKTLYIQANGTVLVFVRSGVTDIDLDNVSIEEVGWSGLTDLYNGLIAQGQTAAQAQLAVSAWCHHSNNLALGSVYGKIYNGYAKDLLVADLASSNFGYHVATEAEWNAILATGVAGLKAMGTNYWTSANGTNITGLTILGGASRSETGAFNTIKSTVSFWCDDVNECFTLNDNGTYSFDAKDLKFGAYVLLVKNY